MTDCRDFPGGAVRVLVDGAVLASLIGNHEERVEAAEQVKFPHL